MASFMSISVCPVRKKLFVNLVLSFLFTEIGHFM